MDLTSFDIHLYKLAHAYNPGIWSWFVTRFFLTMSCCLPRPETYRLMRLHFFGATAFTFRFRLECFAVYASSPLLPPETQDSLRSGTGFTFYDGTFTRKIDATSCRTQDTCKEI